jgi:acyl carrier protein
MATPAEKLESAFRSGLALPLKSDVRTITATTTRQWDSVAHLQLVGAIEKDFGVELSPGDVMDLDSYAAAIAILQRLNAWPAA